MGLKPRFSTNFSDMIITFNYLGYIFAELHIKLGDTLSCRGQPEVNFLR
jgi:hypothetical protein